ncbi:MAG TPA: Mur ligase domain-containing protein [Candidatus Saccharimonadales bacterium]|nr:Mur ligase domain-containing protein [Candidatus Saccharimonadales bacterium]
MRIFFSGIGGGALGPLALIAKQAGYEVVGSDSTESAYTKQLQKQGVELYIGQDVKKIEALHAKTPIDWLVFTSAITRADPNHPELTFAKQQHLKYSLRDELLNKIITDQKLKLIGIAGTHGKSTTTAMVIWLFHQIGVPIGYSVGAKIPWAPMGQLMPGAEYFVYECDEFDNNFLAFHPHLALITGVGWDHHEIFPTKESYVNAYVTFLSQSEKAIMWEEDMKHLNLMPSSKFDVVTTSDPRIAAIGMPGEFNRRDAWEAVLAVHKATDSPIDVLIGQIEKFPGLKQRMEQLAPGLYTNYAHTPEKIRGGMSAALEIAGKHHQKVIIIYEPLTNRRQHFIKDDYKDSFAGADKVYWVRSYLAREDPNLPLLTPTDLIKTLSDPSIAEPAEIDGALGEAIKKHLRAGDMVVAMGASGGGSLDEWLRAHLKELTE